MHHNQAFSGVEIRGLVRFAQQRFTLPPLMPVVRQSVPTKNPFTDFSLGAAPSSGPSTFLETPLMLKERRHPLAARFERFASECAKQASPFYERLSKYVADNDELLDIAVHASRESIPNVFFAAVHLGPWDARPGRVCGV